MGWEADFIGLINKRKEGEEAGRQLGNIRLAEMTGPNSCRIGNLPLSPEDLLFNERLLSPVAVSVSGRCPADGELQDQSEYAPALAAGDQVAVCRISETKYLVLGKMVSV